MEEVGASMTDIRVIGLSAVCSIHILDIVGLDTLGLDILTIIPYGIRHSGNLPSIQ